MKRLDQAIAGATLAALLSLNSCQHIEGPDALCSTDSECAELCPEGTRDLPPDHPDYCDGGPQS